MIPTSCHDCNRPVSAFERDCPSCACPLPPRPIPFFAICCAALLLILLVNVWMSRSSL